MVAAWSVWSRRSAADLLRDDLRRGSVDLESVQLGKFVGGAVGDDAVRVEAVRSGGWAWDAVAHRFAMFPGRFPQHVLRFYQAFLGDSWAGCGWIGASVGDVSRMDSVKFFGNVL